MTFTTSWWKDAIHKLLNTAVLKFGDCNFVGDVLWWCFKEWQRFM